jgi:hypothetical protein
MIEVECGSPYTASFGWDKPIDPKGEEGFQLAVCIKHPLPALYIFTCLAVIFLFLSLALKLISVLKNKTNHDKPKES